MQSSQGHHLGEKGGKVPWSTESMCLVIPIECKMLRRCKVGVVILKPDVMHSFTEFTSEQNSAKR